MFDKILKKFTEKQLESVSEIKSLYDFNKIVALLDSLSKKNVFVLGEPIIDTYIFCETAGISSKSPTVSMRYLYKEDYAGGSLAVARHLRELGCNVTLLITHGGEQLIYQVIEETKKTGINVVDLYYKDIPTPHKMRYLTTFQKHKIFELINIRTDQWNIYKSNEFCDHLSKLSHQSDLTLVCDYGHGLFENEVLKVVNDLNSFRAVNVQTNSENVGYNLFTKYNSYDYLSLDEREFRLALHDRFSPIDELILKGVKHVCNKPFALTLGTNGSIFKAEKFNHSPAFVTDAIDSIGAGDAFFALTSVLTQMNAPQELIPFLGNAYAGLYTLVLGNKFSISKKQLLDFTEEMYKWA